MVHNFFQHPHKLAYPYKGSLDLDPRVVSITNILQFFMILTQWIDINLRY